MDTYIEWPGKVREARVLVNSSLYQNATSSTLLPNWNRRLCGVDIPLIILGDPAYPLCLWLMKPYIENSNTSAIKAAMFIQLPPKPCEDDNRERLWKMTGTMAMSDETHGCILEQCTQYCCHVLHYTTFANCTMITVT